MRAISTVPSLLNDFMETKPKSTILPLKSNVSQWNRWSFARQCDLYSISHNERAVYRNCGYIYHTIPHNISTM